ncbi:MAG TPA: GNAT family N-acetyltransferase [Roseiarcus sp.]|nr:GNAT family N-acetyltransferase [Roseiarcus sp.]
MSDENDGISVALIVRPASIDELPELSDLCFRSKAMWGYDEAFMNACRGELSFAPLDLELTHVGVAEESGKILGVVQIRVRADDAELLKLFVEPKRLREGTGRALFSWAIDISGKIGAHRIIIESDPDAVLFYRAMGARDAGEAPSGSISGRMLPRLLFDVAARSVKMGGK